MEVSSSWVNHGYRVLRIDKVQKQHSHYVWWQNTEYWPQRGEHIHHINFDKLDDRFENLQLMTHKEHTSLHHIDTTHTEETKAKMSLAKMGENNPHYGKVGINNPKWITGPVCYKTQQSRIAKAKKRIAEGCGTLADHLLIQQNE